VVRAEVSADDGSIELSVELRTLRLLQLARTAGVQILEVQGQTALWPGWPTYNRRVRADQQRLKSRELLMAWINQAVRTNPWDAPG